MSLSPDCHPMFDTTYVAAQGLLFDRWTGPVGPARPSEHYPRLLALAQQHHGCRFWVLDLQQYSWSTPAHSPLFSHYFALHAGGVLGCPLFIAYVVSPAHYEEALVSTPPRLLQLCAAHQIYPVFFDAEADALAWLRHQQSLDVAYCAQQAA
jgi:hypothetical protein